MTKQFFLFLLCAGIEIINHNVLIFFYKQPIYKQLTLVWQIAKQLSGFNPLSPSNNKNYRFRKRRFFPLK